MDYIDEQGNEYVSANNLAAYLGLSRKQISRHIDDKVLKHLKLGRNKMILKDDILRHYPYVERILLKANRQANLEMAIPSLESHNKSSHSETQSKIEAKLPTQAEAPPKSPQVNDMQTTLQELKAMIMSIKEIKVKTWHLMLQTVYIVFVSWLVFTLTQKFHVKPEVNVTSQKRLQMELVEKETRIASLESKLQQLVDLNKRIVTKYETELQKKS